MNTPVVRPMFTLRNLIYSLLWFMGIAGAVISGRALSLGTQIKAVLGMSDFSLPLELAVRRGHLVSPPIQWPAAISGLMLTVWPPSVNGSSVWAVP